MPSLRELGQFKSSFQNISNEKADIESLNLPFDDLTLPTEEAPPFNYSRDMPHSGGPAGDVDFTPDKDGVDTESPESDIDFSAFLDELPGGSPKPAEAASGMSALDDLLSGIGGASNEVSSDTASDDYEETADTTEDSSFLDDLPEDIPPHEETAPEFTVEDVSSAEDLNLPDFGDEPLTLPDDDFNFGGDFNAGAEPLSDDSLNLDGDDYSLDTSSLPDFDESGMDNSALDTSTLPDFDESGMESSALDTSSLPDFDESGMDSSALDTSTFPDFDDSSLDTSSLPDFQTDDDSLPDLDISGGIDLGGELPAVSSDFSADDALPDFDTDFDNLSSSDTGTADSVLGSDFPDFDNSLFDNQSGTDSAGAASDIDFDLGDITSAPPSGEGSADIGLGDLGADFDSGSIDLGAADTPEEEHLSDDVFAFDGLDDILNKSKAEPPPAAAAPKKGLFNRKKAQAEETPEAEEIVEEISLKQNDVDKLLVTLSQYPLNMRIIIEELIAEQVILPQQLSKLLRLLINGAPVKETAALVESITGKPVVIPKSFEKMTGAAFEEEQASFGYIFVHNFLPVIKLFAFIILIAGSVLYLAYRFIYTPLHAESIYRRGYERIPAGEYQRANELFNQAFEIHRKKNWFYSYAEAFRDQRRYSLAEGKYDELLRYYPRDKKGILDYANLNTNYLMNYEKANRLLQRDLLDFAPDDMEGLLAAGDNFLLWADSDPERFYNRYEDARFSYARLLETQGWKPGIVERMMKYFIRVDNLKETLYLRVWFDNNSKYRLSADSLAELGGYLLDKQLQKPSGVPDPYIESIYSVRDMLLQAVMAQPTLPEPHYHLSRYYNNLNNVYEERRTLENAIRAFDLAETESVKRRKYRVDTHYRYANLLINNSEFFPAEENVVRGIELYEDFMNRNLISGSAAQLGQLYALNGDLEYFVKSGNMEAALKNYHTAERYGYSPPEIQYRMGAAYYQREDWGNSLNYLFNAAAELPLNRRLLYALGNTAYHRGDYFAAYGYFNRLLDILESQRIRLPVLLPNDNALFLETGERLMFARNNLGVVNEMLAEQTGNREYRSSALVMYAESARAWDAITRNPQTMTRMRLTDSPGAPSINLGYLNSNNALHPSSEFAPQIFSRIDRDVNEPSRWEELTGY